MTRVAKIVVAAIGLQVAVAAAQPQRESGVRPAFEAATIKLSTGPSRANIVTQPSPTRYSIPGMTLKALIYVAYGDGGFNTSMSVRGGPDWANRTVYTVEGVAAAPATRGQMRLMLQSLLEERFALKLHDASDTDAALGDVLTLVVDRSDGKLGPKVKPWDGTCPAAVPPMVMQAPRRPLQREGDQLVVGLASAADDPDMPYCPTGFRPRRHADRRCHDVHRGADALAAAGSGAPGHHHGGSHRADGPLHVGSGLPFHRSGAATGFRRALVAYGHQGTVGIAAGAGQGAPQAARHRRRTAAGGELGCHVVAQGSVIATAPSQR